MMRKIPLAWRQLSRNKSRLLVALAGITFADILMFMQLGFQTALYDSNTIIHQKLRGDLFITSTQARNWANMETFPRRRLYQAMSFKNVEAADALYINFADWKNPKTRRTQSILVMGFDPEKSVFNLPEVNQNLDKIKLPDTLMFDRASRGEYDSTVIDLEAGKIVTTELESRRIELQGLFTVGASFAADGSLITSDLNFQRIFPKIKAGQVSVGVMTLKPNADPQATAKVLKSGLPGDIKILNRQEFIEFEKEYWKNNTAIGFIFSLGALMGFIVGIVIVYQILYSDVSDHLPEYATLKAMGYTNTYLLSVVLQEALILAILGFVPGFNLSLFLYSLTRNATRLPIAMVFDRSLLVLALTILMCVISGIIAIQKLRETDPAEIF
ncbi:MAG: ABC transporter permease DevC [Nostoc desertorum CM1-VF14]|jgi:putative ABC transport system permease protein|nr:ABC transporter permease DevC [Nostoc desertorum CM1-VF14]